MKTSTIIVGAIIVAGVGWVVYRLVTRLPAASSATAAMPTSPTAEQPPNGDAPAPPPSPVGPPILTVGQWALAASQTATPQPRIGTPLTRATALVMPSVRVSK